MEMNPGRLPKNKEKAAKYGNQIHEEDKREKQNGYEEEKN